MKMRTSTNMRLIKLFCAAAASIVTLNTQAQQFVKKQEIFGANRWGAMCIALNNKIYAGGGYIGNSNEKDWQMYDPATNKWVAKGNLPGATNRSAGVTFVINGKAYLGLGAENFLSFTKTPMYLSDLWEYDPAADKWTQKQSLPDTGRTSSGVIVVNNKAYIVAGETTPMGSVTSDVWEYDPVANKWTAKKSLPVSMRDPFAFALGSKGYIMGGTVKGGGDTKATYQYDAAADTWTPKKDFPDTARDGGVSFVAAGKAFIGLGSNGTGGYPKSFYTYDPVSDNWSLITNKWPVTGRYYPFAAVIGDKAYIGGGVVIGNTGNTSFQRDLYEMDVVKVLGISDAESTESIIKCYPNPAKGTLYVDGIAAGAQYSLYHVTGQKVLAGTLPSQGSIDVHELPAGQYILEVSSEKAISKTKVALY